MKKHPFNIWMDESDGQGETVLTVLSYHGLMGHKHDDFAFLLLFENFCILLL